MTMSYDDAGTSGAQRFKIFTGAGRRRDWPDEVKASIVAESFSGREMVCTVARRHALSPSQLLAWRRETIQSVIVSRIHANCEGQPVNPQPTWESNQRGLIARMNPSGNFW
jgi:transposase-like protein